MSKRTYLAAAKAWDAANRPASSLLTGDYQLTALRCWVGNKPEHKEDPEQKLIREFANSSIEHRTSQDAGWYENFLSTRSFCERCGERYRIENLAICSVCNAEICHRCITEPSSGPGRYLHHCGGDLVG